MSTRGYFSVVVSKEGKIYSCGYNDCGQLGLGSSSKMTAFDRRLNQRVFFTDPQTREYQLIREEQCKLNNRDPSIDVGLQWVEKNINGKIWKARKMEYDEVGAMDFDSEKEGYFVFEPGFTVTS